MGLALHGSPAQTLLKAVLSQDFEEQKTLIQSLIGVDDPIILQGLGAWRNGSLYLHESPDGVLIPFLLDSALDENETAKGLRLENGEVLQDENGQPIRFSSWELTPADTTPSLRKVIKGALDVYALGNPKPRTRRDAAVKLGQEQDSELLGVFRDRLKVEEDRDTRKALEEAIALTETASDNVSVRLAAVGRLETMRSINSLSFLQNMDQEARSKPGQYGPETEAAIHHAVLKIENYIWVGNLFGTAFRGISLAAVLLVAALGLAITFGLMGIINMAHGEMIMIGAYTAYVVQNIFQSSFGASGLGFDLYFLPALGCSFLTAGLVGLGLERGIIRFLYKRPLESLLATWGVSLVLRQVFRHIFGAANVQVSSPRWLSGSFVIYDVLLAYNRLFVIGFAVFIVVGTYLLLTRTSLGLQIRAVMQNRSMASCVGVRTDRVNMITFTFGSGLAGMAGACLSQIGNVGPGLGQNHIIDCFMIVVLGGIGNLFGTVAASLGVGVTDQILQPWLGAVMGKITVLAAIILFLQWRPAGLFAMRSRSLEG